MATQLADGGGATAATEPCSDSSTKSDDFTNRGCLLKIRQQRSLPPNAEGANKALAEAKEILFGHWRAAHKFSEEKIKAVQAAKFQVNVFWHLIEDDVYRIAADPIKELEQIRIASPKTMEALRNHLEKLKISSTSQLEIEACILPLPLSVYQERPVAQNMHNAARRRVAKETLAFRKKGSKFKSWMTVIRAEDVTQEASGWGWNDTTEVDTWQELSFEKEYKQISWGEQSYRETCLQQRSKVTMSTITGNGNKGRNPKAKFTDSRVNDKPVATSSASQKDKKKFQADVKARMIERLHKGRSDPRILRSITVARGCSSDGKGCAACRANTR
ncbi:uncharacterized protein RAG0_12927 [Rhynchosporium agropyri]|uniref:Uncharacterized protein n=1 Tax=Rhynchosporium agropyri TaxID=914238 RepID=A0A1E1LAI5_9HELO|nr:uncharacterized protein RAG0_12927 [Rhynchosporium agropyri]